MTEADLEATITANLARALAIENPLWDYVKDVPHDEMFGQFNAARFTPSFYTLERRSNGDPAQFIDYRHYVTSAWAWAITSPETLAFILGILDGRPVVEMGAGNGYWAWMLSQLGVDVLAYDGAPIGHDGSWFSEEILAEYVARGVSPVEFHPVKKGGPAMLRRVSSERVLLLVWPSYDTDFAFDALENFRGDTMIYVGEGPGGCTGNDRFFDALELFHEEIAHGPLIQWAGIHDYMSVYSRR